MRKARSAANARVPILAALALFLGSLPAAAAAPDKTKGFFPVSVWYSGGKARAPMLETVTPGSREAWKKDIDQIKRLGFNTVRTWIEWTACEKSEGQYDFSALELLTDLAGEAGLRVIVQVYIDSAPDWVGVRHPDSKFVSSNGVAVESQASPGFCFDHDGVQEKILDFFKAAARALKGKPAFYGWDLWSEPHIINWAEVYYVGDLSSVQFCYCHSTQARFRDWLRKKYGTIEALNKAWYRTLASFDEVQPPRFGTILTFTDYIDWKEFISDKLAEDLALKAAAVKSVLPGLGRHQPLGRARDLHPAGLVGNARRPEDVRQRRFLRRLDLPQARLDDQALVALLPLLGPRLRPVHGHRERRLLYRRAPGRLRRLRHEDELPGRRHGHPRLDVERGRLRRPGRQHLRLLSHEHRLRGRRLRPGRARRQGHRTGRGRRPDRPHHHGQPGPLPQGPAGPSRDRHPL